MSEVCRWDFCINRGSVVDHIDGHTDIIYLQLYNDWLPWYVLIHTLNMLL